MYRHALDEGRRSLDDQVKELDSIRQRTVQFLAFMGAATAFLVGTGLSAADRDRLFFILSIAASVATVGTILLAVSVMLSLHVRQKFRAIEWKLHLSAQILVDWIEQDVPRASESDFLRALSLKYDEMVQYNRARLKILRDAYTLFLVVSFVQLFLWGALVWMRA